MSQNHPIRQICYYVDDVREAAKRHHAMFGSGPYFILDNIEQTVTHRGKEAEFRASTALGQWGPIQIELAQSNQSGPSVFHDLYPEGSGRYGLHHVAIIVDDFDAEVAKMKAAGFDEAMRSYMPELEMPQVFMDTVALYGHFTEIYPSVPKLLGFYDMVEEAAKTFDGSDLLREAAV